MKYYGILFFTVFHCANASNGLNTLGEKKAEVTAALNSFQSLKKKKLSNAFFYIDKQSEYIEALEKNFYINEESKELSQYIKNLESSIKELKHSLDDEKERNELFRSQLVILTEENDENKLSIKKLNNDLNHKDDENKDLKEKIESIHKENENAISRYELDFSCLEEIYEKKINDLKQNNETLEDQYLDIGLECKKIETDFKKLQLESLVEKEKLAEENKDLKGRMILLSKKYEARKKELEDYKNLYLHMLSKQTEEETVTLIIEDENEDENEEKLKN